jgi:hypothetical protein
MRAGSATSSEDAAVRGKFEDIYARDAARCAVRGASQWLALAKCQALFLEFKDERRLPLTARLRELDTNPEGYLRMVLFLDGAQSAPCNRHGVLALTSQGSRVSINADAISNAPGAGTLGTPGLHNS